MRANRHAGQIMRRPYASSRQPNRAARRALSTRHKPVSRARHIPPLAPQSRPLAAGAAARPCSLGRYAILFAQRVARLVGRTATRALSRSEVEQVAKERLAL